MVQEAIINILLELDVPHMREMAVGLVIHVNSHRIPPIGNGCQ